jgi:glycosyltransferase involved in cell wall biosynthesis
MKIAIFHNNLSLRRGAERLLLDILEYFPKEWDITILTRKYDKVTAFPEFQNLNIQVFRGFRDLLNLEKFDILFSWLPFPNYFFGAFTKRFNKRNKKSTHIWYSGGAFLPNREKPKFAKIPLKWMSDWAIKNTKKVFTLSNYIRQELLDYNKKDSKVIYCGINSNDFKIDFIGKNKIPLILFPTFIHKAKGIYDVFEASKNLLQKGVKFKLVITGGGPEKELLEKLIKEKNLEKDIIVKANICDKDLKKLYNQCDFTLYPVLKGEFGLVLLESLLYNKPIIYRNEGAPKEIMKNFPGKISFDNVLDLEQKMRLLIENPRRRVALGRGGRNYVLKNFDVKMTADKLKQELLKLK